MSLHASEIGLVVSVLEKALVGASVREVLSEPEMGRVTLGLRYDGVNHYLRIAISPEGSRLGRIDRKPRGAPSPHPFVMLLRREIVGLLLTGIEWVNEDRIVRFFLGRGERRCAVVAELTGRHGNLFWLDADGVIGGSMFQNRSLKRALFAGQRYEAPDTAPTVDGGSRFEAAETLEADIDAFYRETERDAKWAQKRALVAKMIRAARRRTERRVEKLETDLSRAESGDTLQTHGHVLKAHLREVDKGATRFETFDFEGNPLTIPLDPKLSAVANMERMFGKAKRFSRAVSQIEARVLKGMADLEQLGEFEDALLDSSPDTLASLEARLVRHFPYLRKITVGKQRTPVVRLPYREYAISHGRVARVGRGAKDNDALTLRHSKPQDLWLHVRGASGSHVVVPMGRNDDPQPDTLVDAAHLAAHFSKLSTDSAVEVIYTQRRYVQKPRGSAPGSVRLIREKTLCLTVEPERLSRILKTRDTAG